MKTMNAKPTPKNITELRDDLLEIYAAIGTGAVNLNVAKEKSNAAGKIIKSASVQLEYAIARKEKPSIPFMK
jgi:hypothetical protein